MTAACDACGRRFGRRERRVARVDVGPTGTGGALLMTDPARQWCVSCFAAPGAHARIFPACTNHQHIALDHPHTIKAGPIA